MLALKKDLNQALLDLMDERIDQANKMISSARESQANETKSSMGDKYETGREMIAAELSKAEAQLGKALFMKNEIAKLPTQNKTDVVEPGALVMATNGTYYIASGLGVFDFENKKYFVISLASPVGQMMLGKKEGESFAFNNVSHQIKEIW